MKKNTTHSVAHLSLEPRPTTEVCATLVKDGCLGGSSDRIIEAFYVQNTMPIQLLAGVQPIICWFCLAPGSAKHDAHYPNMKCLRAII